MTSLYVPTVESAQRMLLDIGGGIFGHEILAYDIGQDLWRRPDGADPRLSAWYTFYETLENYGDLADAFTSAWKEQEVMRYILRRGLNLIDAEDVRQNVMIQAWDSLHHFKPWKGHWVPWLLNIANWRVIDFLRKEWYVDHIPVSYDEIEMVMDSYPRAYHPDADKLTSTRIIVEKGWSIPLVCERWMKHSHNPKRAKFAEVLLLNYRGYDWVAPTGTYMEDIVGTYRRQLWVWWHEFIAEVLSNEEGEI